MTETYDNSNHGAMFKVRQKRSEKSPDLFGNIEPVCPSCRCKTRFKISGWFKQPRDTNKPKYISLALQHDDEMDQRPASERSGHQAGGQQQQFNDDDIPF